MSTSPALKPTPSGSHIWSKCQAYLEMATRYREIESKDQNIIGTAAHALACDILRSGRILTDPPEYSEYRQKEYNGVEITQEMFDDVMIYVYDVIEPLTKSHPDRTWGGSEVKMKAPNSPMPFSGIVDAYFYDTDNNTLNIWDFKYGRRPVEAVDNPQLIIYAAMAADHIGIEPDKWKETKVNLSIIQPLTYSRVKKRWSLTGKEIRVMYKELITKITQIYAGGRTATPGRHCAYCPAKIHCEAALTMADDYHGMTIEMPDIGEMNNRQIANFYERINDASDILFKMIETVESEITQRIKNGKVVPGYELKKTASREFWKEDAEKIMALTKMLGVNLQKEPELVTPKQARAELKRANMPESMLDNMSERKAGVKLSRINLNQIQEDFNHGR